MKTDMFSHLMRADLGTFHDEASGRLISRFTNDIYLMRNALSNVLTSMARDTLSIIFLVGVMFYQSWVLALIAFMVYPIAVLPVLKLGRRMRKLSDSTQNNLGTLASKLDETFSGVRMVKAYGREEFEIARARTIIDRLCALYIKSARVQAAASPIIELLSSVAIAAVVWYGGAQVINGTTTPGAFFSFVTAMIMAYKPARALSSMNNYVQDGLASAARFFAVLDSKPTIQDAPDATSLKVPEGEIRLDHVSFHYTADGGGIDDISLVVPAGKTAALVGLSGSGKSTIINLLLRFYDTQSGRIAIDDQDIRSVTQHSLREAIALVSQDTTLFDDTVRSNIAYGRLNATEEDIVAAATAAAADEFIQGMPNGYDTVIGPNGVKLSGGQRQRIAIARAILKNAPILLLDEATSSLDTESERAVQRALEILSRGRTTLIVAHRLSTILHADIIYVLQDGKIAESGSHAQLLKQGGRYAQLYGLQFESGATALPA